MSLGTNRTALVLQWTAECQLVTMETSGHHQLATSLCNLVCFQMELNAKKKICSVHFQQTVNKDVPVIGMYVQGKMPPTGISTSTHS